MGIQRSGCDVCKTRIGNRGGLFPTCNSCRAKGCKHVVQHFDSSLNTVCDGCGTVLRKVKRVFVRTTEAELDVINAMLADGKSLNQINRKTLVPEKIIMRIKNGTYKTVKNILS